MVRLHKPYQTKHCTIWTPDALAAQVVCMYLFEGLSVKDIEERLLGTKTEQSGFLAKVILNYYGIDTSKESENRGIYHGHSIEDVCHELRKSNDRANLILARLLAKEILYGYPKSFEEQPKTVRNSTQSAS